MSKIYLSSTYSDLRVYREAVYRILRRMRHDVIAMEDYVAVDQRPLDKCLADVAECDLYIGIIAWRYGFIPTENNPQHKSITELEYDKAVETDKPRLLFLLSNDAAWSPIAMDVVTGDGGQGRFIDKFRQVLTQASTVSFFNSPEDLVSLVPAAVNQWEVNQLNAIISATLIHVKPQTIEFSIQQGEINTFDADVIALKYSQVSLENDEIVSCLRKARIQTDKLRPRVGEYCYAEAKNCVKAHHILFVGAPNITDLNYHHIQEFSGQTLYALAQQAPNTRHLAMTTQGIDTGLDEIEALLAQFDGYLDAIQREQLPLHLQYISVVENNLERVNRLRQAFEKNLENVDYASKLSGSWGFRLDIGKLNEVFKEYQKSVRATRRVNSKPKKHIFVAMPFKKEMDDVFYYGIQLPVRAAGFICERIDKEAFIGDILDKVKEKIDNASVVIADLTDANPNVYLEVGYAWGKGRPTILLMRHGHELRFDVRGQKCLIYERIMDLDESLRNELEELKTKDVIGY